MYGVSHSQNDERALSRQREALFGGVEAGTRCILDFTDANTLLADDRADEDMWDEETKRVALGLRAGW